MTLCLYDPAFSHFVQCQLVTNSRYRAS